MRGNTRQVRFLPCPEEEEADNAQGKLITRPAEDEEIPVRYGTDKDTENAASKLRKCVSKKEPIKPQFPSSL